MLGQYNEVTRNLKEVAQTLTPVKNTQGEIDKTVTKMKQTNEEFNKSIETLTKKDSEITNKLNIVEDTVEGTKKTISKV